MVVFGWALAHCGVDRNPLAAAKPTATGCGDRALRLWEIGTGRTVLTVMLPEPADRIVAVTAGRFIVLYNGCLIAADDIVAG
jgi:hypothetical protein